MVAHTSELSAVEAGIGEPGQSELRFEFLTNLGYQEKAPSLKINKTLKSS